MTALCLLASVFALACPAFGKVNSTELTQWLPELPPFSHSPDTNRARHLAEWMPHVHPGMSVTQVLVLLGPPDWGVTTRGKLRWVVDPRTGVLQYSANGRGDFKGNGRQIRIHFDTDARVKRIEENGVIVAKGRRALLPEPLPHGVGGGAGSAPPGRRPPP